MCASSLTRRLAVLERRGDPPGQLADEIRRAVTVDEFLARELGQEPRPRHEIEAMVRAGRKDAEIAASCGVPQKRVWDVRLALQRRAEA